MAFPWLINGVDPNYYITWMILQVLGIRWVPLGSQNTFFGVLLTDRLYNLDLPTYPTQDGFQWLKNQGLALGQLLVNCWFGAFGGLGFESGYTQGCQSLS